MRTAKEDIALLGEAGLWESERDPLMNAVVLLCMYAKGRHKPLRNLHNLAKAVEKGDSQATRKFYARLSQEVSSALRKYPEIAGTLETLSQMSDMDMAQIDRVMQEYE